MNPTTTVVEPAQALPEITSLVHHLRNPLSAIYNSAEVLIGSKLSEPQVHRIARNLFGASVRMRELLDEILIRYSGTNREVEFSDLRELVSNAVDKIALVAEAQSVRIVRNVPENLMIPLDRQRIQRVLVNLLVNALDVMPSAGSIRISVVLEHHSALIKVRDTGPGIAPEIRERLIRPFATAREAGGLGLGLAFSRQAVLDHGGRMWVESSSAGACFAFCLPRTTGQRRSQFRTRWTGGAESSDSLSGSL